MVAKSVVAVIHRKDVPGQPNRYSMKDVQFVRYMLKEALDYLGGLASFVKSGDRVIIKPNCLWPSGPESIGTTDPRIVEALLVLIREETDAKDVTIAEFSSSVGFGIGTYESFVANGIETAAKRQGAKLLALENDIYLNVDIPKAMTLRRIALPRTLLAADTYINLPKLKTHYGAKITCAIKNQHGLLTTKDKWAHHRDDLPLKLIDLLTVIKPDLNIVDGLCAMQGQGPLSPYPEDRIYDMNTIIAGRDIVAVDAVCAEIMGIGALEPPTTRLGNLRGIGIGDLNRIEVKGNKITEVKRQFKRADPDIVAVFPQVHVYIGGACVPGCLNTIRGALDWLAAEGTLKKLKNKVAIVVGHDAKLPDPLPTGMPIFVIGDCAIQYSELGRFFPGCVPMQAWSELQEEIRKLVPTRQ